ncbi:hypothetical protein M3Y99_00128900 [Aphelenchoides fujianensis]|nr:hypothetical protein M3Y99_00128900 [Aphelenchoides fujianensis]
MRPLVSIVRVLRVLLVGLLAVSQTGALLYGGGDQAEKGNSQLTSAPQLPPEPLAAAAGSKSNGIAAFVPPQDHAANSGVVDGGEPKVRRRRQQQVHSQSQDDDVDKYTNKVVIPIIIIMVFFFFCAGLIGLAVAHQHFLDQRLAEAARRDPEIAAAEVDQLRQDPPVVSATSQPSLVAIGPADR